MACVIVRHLFYVELVLILHGIYVILWYETLGFILYDCGNSIGGDGYTSFEAESQS